MRFHFSRFDALLVLMALIWGANYSVIKAALQQIPPIAFNTLRLIIAAVLFVVTMRLRGEGGGLSRRDWSHVVGLAFVGQFVYQLLFMKGLSMTSASNSSLIIGCTPVFVAILSAVLGHERISGLRWAAVLASAAGIYLVVGNGAHLGGASIAGDLTMLGAVFCWALATIGAKPLLARHSAVVITGYGMVIGSLLHLPFAWPELRQLHWAGVGAGTWVALGLSATLSLYVCYLIWYTALHHLGNTRTSVYSNMVPIAGMATAWLALGEPLGLSKLAGAAAIILGVVLSKIHVVDDTPTAEPA